MKIRQVALAATNLEETDKTFRHLLGCDQTYADPEIIYFGLDNRLYTLGDCFLEVVSPVQPNTRLPVVFLIAAVVTVATWLLCRSRTWLRSKCA